MRKLFCSILLFSHCYAALIVDNPSSRGVLKIHQDKVPEWVSNNFYDSIHDPEKNEGKAILLQESQINLDTNEIFFKEVYKLLNIKDIPSFSDIQITIDPAIEDLTLHYVNIIRNGKLLERLDSSVIRIDSWKNKHSFIFNDRQRVIVFFENLQVNDIIEYAFTRKYEIPVFNCDLFLSDSSFVQKILHRVLSEQPCLIKNFLTDSVPQQNTFGSQREYKWIFTNIEPTTKAQGTPSWYSNEPKIQIHKTESWKPINDYKILEVSPEQEEPSIELRNLIENIKNQNVLIEDQILESYRYVANHIFYRSLNPTNRAYKPNTVLKRGYGDCKDKTYLLIEMLKLLNIQAYPALVNTREKHTIINQYPIDNFGHMIACIEFEGEFYFLDPTIENAGGRLGNIFLQDYGYALVLKSDTDSLTQIHPTSALSKRRKEYLFKVDQEQKSATLFLSHDYSGEAADIRRGYLVPGSEPYVANSWKDFLVKKFGETKVLDPIKTDDDLDENRIKSSCSFFIESFGKYDDSSIEYLLKPTIILSPLEKIDSKRTAPYELEKDIQEEIITLKFSKKCPQDIEIQNIQYQDDYLDYLITWQKITDQEIQIHVKFSILKDWIEAKDYPRFHQQVTKFEKAMEMRLREGSV